MYCSKCGQMLAEDEKFCSTCGAKTSGSAMKGVGVAPGGVVGSVKNAAGSQKPDALKSEAQAAGSESGQTYNSYEYARIAVKGELAQVALDCYESLGYELTGQKSSGADGQMTLSFRRSRKVRDKAQLAKMQRTMDDLIASIADLEAAKAKKALTQALLIGIISTLVLGLGMSCVMVWGGPLMAVGIALGLAGIGGCLFAWMRHRKVCATETARISPRIHETYDRLATACEEAQALLRAQA